jgi:hypothetical protein
LNSFLSKLAPQTNYITDSVSLFNSALESGIKVVRGASFDKKEFKRNVAGSGAYAPTTTVAKTHITTRRSRAMPLQGQ